MSRTMKLNTDRSGTPAGRLAVMLVMVALALIALALQAGLFLGAQPRLFFRFEPRGFFLGLLLGLFFGLALVLLFLETGRLGLTQGLGLFGDLALLLGLFRQGLARLSGVLLHGRVIRHFTAFDVGALAPNLDAHRLGCTG